MLNDVSVPPLEPKPSKPTTPVYREIPGHHHPARPDRAHSLERTADHGMGTNLVFNDPEDRGDSFNTMMSAVIAGTVLTIVAIVAWLMFR